MTSFPSSNEKCATCEYWGGERELKSGGHSVSVSSVNDYGECYAGTFSSVTQGFPACRQKCKNYEKWRALK